MATTHRDFADQELLSAVEKDLVQYNAFGFARCGREEKYLTARAKPRAQRNGNAVRKHFNLGEEQATPVPVAERSFPFCTYGKSRCLLLRPSTKTSRLHIVVAFIPPPQK